ncbi:MAG: phosphate-starvation-inducible PsiE family protein [Syntrophaceae bacterium]|nr:phosphate-starvation-inducible PsiE family protein [Syntrophaceae bacterium]
MKIYEKIMIQALMVMMAIVLGLATIDLAWLLIKDILGTPFLILSIEQLLELFGLFMLVIIGIELLESIMKTYLTPNQPHYEVVLVVAIIAIARKVIILDVKEVDSLSLLGIASITVALTLGYFLMKRSQFYSVKKSTDNKDNISSNTELDA